MNFGKMKKYQDAILNNMEAMETEVGNYGVYVMNLELVNSKLKEKGDEMAKEYSGVLTDYNKTLPENDFMDFQTIGEWYELYEITKPKDQHTQKSTDEYIIGLNRAAVLLRKEIAELIPTDDDCLQGFATGLKRGLKLINDLIPKPKDQNENKN